MKQSLFLMRLSIFAVMLMWTIDKLIRPEHALAVFKKFYYLDSLSNGAMCAVGIIELAILCGFLLGVKKNFTYAFVLIVHAISTLSSFRQYTAPFEGGNLLFFAAWPMLAGCVLLYVNRKQDVIFAVG